MKDEPFTGSAIQMIAWQRTPGAPVKVLAAADPRKRRLRRRALSALTVAAVDDGHEARGALRIHVARHRVADAAVLRDRDRVAVGAARADLGGADGARREVRAADLDLRAGRRRTR